MSKKMMVLVILGILTVVVATAAIAAPRFSIGSDLNLRENQYDKLKSIDNKYFDSLDVLREKGIEKSRQLRQMYLQTNPDENAIEKAEEELLKIREEIFNLRKKASEERYEILDDEQKRNLEEIRGYGREYRGAKSRGLGRGIGQGFGHGQGLGFSLRDCCGIGFGR